MIGCVYLLMGITGDGGLMVVVVMVTGVLKWRPEAQNILYLYDWYSMVVKIFFRRRHTLMVGDVAFNYKIDYVWKFWEILNLKGHPNCITGSRETAILING